MFLLAGALLLSGGAVAQEFGESEGANVTQTKYEASTKSKKTSSRKEKKAKKRAAAAVAAPSPVDKIYKVEGGVMIEQEKPKTAADSLTKVVSAMADSLAKAKGLESAAELTNRQLERLRKDSIDMNGLRHSAIFRDSIAISRMCAISMAVPGFGQLYNKQYLKIPVMYAALGGSIAGVVIQHNHYSGYKKRYNELIRVSSDRSPELDHVQSRMIEYNTRRQIFMGLALASYIYQIGDAAINYSGTTTSIKKATTLSTICPGAGQIYNRSFWKVPIVVGGFATMAFVLDFNNRGYKRFQLAYDLASDDNPTTTDEFNGRYPAEFLKNLRNNYRRNRDFAIILTGLAYLINIVDAHVDSQMKVYDVSDNLAWFDAQPSIQNFYSARTGNFPVLGMNLNFRF